MTLSGNFSYHKIWDEGAKRAISSDLGITEIVRLCFVCLRPQLKTKRSKILTTFWTQVFKQQISAKFVDGQSRLDRFQMVDILNIKERYDCLERLFIFN